MTVKKYSLILIFFLSCAIISGCVTSSSPKIPETTNPNYQIIDNGISHVNGHDEIFLTIRNSADHPRFFEFTIVPYNQKNEEFLSVTNLTLEPYDEKVFSLRHCQSKTDIVDTSGNFVQSYQGKFLQPGESYTLIFSKSGSNDIAGFKIEKTYEMREAPNGCGIKETSPGTKIQLR